MGFKSIEIIIKSTPVLNELQKYGAKMIMLATFGSLGMNPLGYNLIFWRMILFV